MKLFISSILLFLLVSPFAQANHDRSYHNHGKHSRKVVKAKVIRAIPVYKYVNTRNHKTYCKPVAVHSEYRPAHSKRAAIFGSIVGGIVGRTVSQNQTKDLGTLMGAVVGGSLAHNIVRAKHSELPTYSVQHNCKPKHKKARKVRVLDGYKVTYRSKGRLYRTFMEEKPTKYIRI
ncbi:glycine zipper 2TM domain-containing protein [uncultured Paraglaciecola sp.]|uniref:glycine zipper 2TM domain-containing protein n=1 Tax=uncultured Paraglaciecola sp. TaxID=1765024 RepID=UPI0026110E8D|nr:glycine zipper 2TM domain-containing protein [uncultured Paraglaciecola sp.]